MSAARETELGDAHVPDYIDLLASQTNPYNEIGSI